MEEIETLRTYIKQGKYSDALQLIDELDEMSRDDKIHKVESYMRVLLIHLIKKEVEQRTTRSWEVSITESLRQIARVNKRRKSGGHYLSESELAEALEEVLPDAVLRASLEVKEGMLDEKQLQGQINETSIRQEAMDLILDLQKKS
jgi:hypothetical protein